MPKLHSKINCDGNWTSVLARYELLIHDRTADSAYLRERGLMSSVFELTRKLPYKSVLDVGCGDGWLLDRLTPNSGYECDIVPRLDDARRWPFQVASVTDLPYRDGQFDLVVASLLLMWVEDLNGACNELRRVVTEGGSLLVALMHPALYRMGSILPGGDVRICERYSEEREICDLHIGGKVGPLRYFHRPLENYFNVLIDAGFAIAEFREWTVDMVDYRRHFELPPTAEIPRTDRLPLFAFIHCRSAE